MSLPNFTAVVVESYQDHIDLWQGELRDWLPETIFDAHVHLGPPVIVSPIPSHRLKEALSTFSSLTWEQARSFYSQLFGGKTIAGLIAFGFPLREVDIGAANRYLAKAAAEDQRIHPFILADPHDIPGTIRQFHELHDETGVRFVGVKPYYDLLRIDKPNSVFHCRDIDFTPMPLLEFMNEQKLALMLHTSGRGGGDSHVRDFVEMAAGRFPRIRVILAHMCRYTHPDQFEELFRSPVLNYPNVFLEMSSAASASVYELTLSRRHLWDRLLFGSDIPFGLITGTEHWSETHGPVFLTRDDYTWSDPELNRRFAAERNRMTYNTYHTIHALKQAMDGLGMSASEEAKLKAAIFSGNAMRLLGGI